eukprot:SAG25_NODE_6268_length_573_cov_0.915612_2_plen_101_part_01
MGRSIPLFRGEHRRGIGRSQSVWADPSHDKHARRTPSGPLCPGVRTWQSSAGECPNAGSSVRIMAATARLACTHCTHRAQNRRHNAREGRKTSVGRDPDRI